MRAGEDGLVGGLRGNGWTGGGRTVHVVVQHARSLVAELVPVKLPHIQKLVGAIEWSRVDVDDAELLPKRFCEPGLAWDFIYLSIRSDICWSGYWSNEGFVQRFYDFGK